MKSYGYLCALLWFSYSAASGQPALNLEEAIRQVQQSSPQAKQIRAAYQGERWRFGAARAALKPQLILEGTAPGFARQIGQVLQPDGSFLFRNYSRAVSSVNVGLSQLLLATGGTISLSTGLSRIDIFGTNRSLFWASTPLILEYNQPLFRINKPRWDWQQQQLSFRQRTQQQAEALEDLAVTATTHFFAVRLAQYQLTNARYNMAINDTLVKIAKSRYELGRIAESDWLQVQLSLLNARNAAEQQEAQLQIARLELGALLGAALDPATQLAPVGAPLLLEVDPALALAQARANRSELTGFELADNQAQFAVKTAEIARQFTVDLAASLGYNQSATGLSQAYRQIQGTQGISVNFKVPLYTAGRNRALVEAARVDLAATQAQNQATLATLEVDVVSQVSILNQLRRSLRLAALADTIARKRFETLRLRYDIGKTDITALTFAQQEKDNSVVTYVQTLRDYWVAYYRLRRLTLYDFTEGRSLLVTDEE